MWTHTHAYMHAHSSLHLHPKDHTHNACQKQLEDSIVSAFVFLSLWGPVKCLDLKRPFCNLKEFPQRLGQLVLSPFLQRVRVQLQPWFYGFKDGIRVWLGLEARWFVTKCHRILTSFELPTCPSVEQWKPKYVTVLTSDVMSLLWQQAKFELASLVELQRWAITFWNLL